MGAITSKDKFLTCLFIVPSEFVWNQKSEQNSDPTFNSKFYITRTEL